MSKKVSTITISFGNPKEQDGNKHGKLSWPRGFNGTVDVELSPKEKSAIIELVGKENLKRVDAIIIVYCVKKAYFDSISVGEMNKKFKLIKEKSEYLLELLDATQLQHFFLNMAEKRFGTDFSLRLAKDPMQPSASLKVIKELKSLNFVCRAHLSSLKPGRPENTKKFAEYYLLSELYKLCRDVQGIHLTNKPGNLLEQIVKILNKPLGLGGTLPGLVRKVITENLPSS